MSEFIALLEAEAVEQLKELRAYRTATKPDSDRRTRARVALGVIRSYVGLRGTIANERSNDLVAMRLKHILENPNPEPKQLHGIVGTAGPAGLEGATGEPGPR